MCYVCERIKQDDYPPNFWPEFGEVAWAVLATGMIKEGAVTRLARDYLVEDPASFCLDRLKAGLNEVRDLLKASSWSKTNPRQRLENLVLRLVRAALEDARLFVAQMRSGGPQYYPERWDSDRVQDVYSGFLDAIRRAYDECATDNCLACFGRGSVFPLDIASSWVRGKHLWEHYVLCPACHGTGKRQDAEHWKGWAVKEEQVRTPVQIMRKVAASWIFAAFVVFFLGSIVVTVWQLLSIPWPQLAIRLSAIPILRQSDPSVSSLLASRIWTTVVLWVATVTLGALFEGFDSAKNSPQPTGHLLWIPPQETVPQDLLPKI